MDDKPDSVLNGHSSTLAVTSKFLHATRSHSSGKDVCKQTENLLALARGGVYPDPACHQASGALLPHLFTLTCTTHSSSHRRYFSVALSLTCNQWSVDVIHHRALPCPDFPRVSSETRDRLSTHTLYCLGTLSAWHQGNKHSLHGLHRIRYNS